MEARRKTYLKPEIEIIEYLPEKGYASSIAVERDPLLIDNNDHSTMRTFEDINEFTQNNENQTGLWSF